MMFPQAAKRSFRLCSILIFFLVSSAIAQNNRTLFASERFVIRAMRTIHGAEATYQATIGIGNFGSLSQLGQAQFIDTVLASGSKYGYTFVLTRTPYSTSPPAPATFRLTATPSRYSKTGRRSFFIATDGVLRGADKNGAPADENDPEIDLCAGMGAAGNEPCTLSSMRTLHGAESTYQATAGVGNFGSLAQLHSAGLISSALADGVAHGYTFTVTTVLQVPGESPAAFSVSAVPIIYGKTGIRSFFIATDGVLRGADHNGGPAGPDDPPVNTQ